MQASGGDHQWTSKYEPRTVAQLVGPRGTPEALLKWVRGWTAGRQCSALLTGPPGCGKTMLARLACKEAGITNVLELNCINKRTKKTIEAIRDAFCSRPVLSFVSSAKSPRPGAVIIDEADFCDQGGLPELIKHIRKSRVPVICIAGDGYSKAIKPLAASSFQLRMLRPSADQIGAHLMMICHCEKIVGKLSVGSARALAAACNCDVRQSILELYMASKSDTLAIARNEDGLVCDRQLGAFDILPKLFPPSSSSTTTTTTVNFSLCERMHHMDKSLVPLLVAENYLKAARYAKKKDLEGLALAADSISMGNVIEGNMLRRGAWDTQDEFAYFATVRPAALSGGPLVAKAEFPTVLAQTTAARKAEVRARDIGARMTASFGGLVPHVSGPEVAADLMGVFACKYVDTYARICLVAPGRCSEAAEMVASEMGGYNLDKSDWDSIATARLLARPAAHAPTPAAKAALTRAFGKPAAPRRSRPEAVDEDDDDDEEPRPKKPRS